jgi:hypothetical protein
MKALDRHGRSAIRNCFGPGPLPRTFDRRLLDKIYDRTPEVNVNVFSSRNVFKFNILGCGGHPQDRVVELAKQPQTMRCKLIGERD